MKVVKLRIPKDSQMGINLIASTEDSEVRALARELADLGSFSVNFDDATEVLIEKLGGKVGISENDLEEILQTVLMMHLVGQRHDMDLDELVESVLDAAEHFENPLTLEREHLSTKLRLLMDSPNLRTVAKSYGLLHEHQRVFQFARVISDLRPIFPHPLERPTGAVISHMLKLTYFEEAKVKEFFVALDTGQLKEMRETLERAEQKAASIRELLKESNIPYFTLEEQE